MKIRQIFLIVTALGLFPIALSYGLMPQKTLYSLFDISVSEPNGTHIFRAVMGLYIAQIAFWLIGAFKANLRQAALYSLTIFMLGLAGGRVFSLIIDGIPHWLLVAYLVLEVLFGLLGVILLKKTEPVN